MLYYHTTLNRLFWYDSTYDHIEVFREGRWFFTFNLLSYTDIRNQRILQGILIPLFPLDNCRDV